MIFELRPGLQGLEGLAQKELALLAWYEKLRLYRTVCVCRCIACDSTGFLVSVSKAFHHGRQLGAAH